MAGVNPVWQNILAVALVIAWTGVLMVLFIRAREKQRAYLRRFPPVEGVPLDIHLPSAGPANVTRAMLRALRQRQTDPELEQLRREVQRRARYIAIWAIGTPIIVLGVLALLAVTGYPH